jgi:signal transduction histidine kinase
MDAVRIWTDAGADGEPDADAAAAGPDPGTWAAGPETVPGPTTPGSASPDPTTPRSARPDPTTPPKAPAGPGATRLTGGWPLGRTIGVGVVIAALLSVLGIILGGAAVSGLDSARSRAVNSLGHLSRQQAQAVASLNHSASVLDATLIGVAVTLLLVVIVFALVLWRSVILPLSRLAGDAREVAGGDFSHQVGSPGGPAEVRAVGMDVDLMRKRILAELSAVRAAHASLEARTEDLQRSNSELEQFAYVASHDLQEPLRKVASFCQLLQRRYAGRLDAKADEYIEHAVDGAKRMQALINDLLAFSRVGRAAQKREPVSCGLLLAQAWANLATEVRRTRATIEQGELPVVLGEASLLTAVFQNLLSNALKFHGDQPPRVSVSVRRDGRYWLFSFSDNGIGIEPEYADRIFVIFQRLHDRATYPGTGIGLAMVRKIIEYHGGQIWLDTSVTSGARFCFTLPVRPQDQDDD